MTRIDFHALLNRGWLSAWLAGFSAWLFGIVVKFPQGLLATDHFPRLQDFLKLCANPLARDLAEPIVAYRISVPIIAWILQLPPAVCTYLQLPFLICAYAVIFHVVARRTRNPTFAALVVAGLSLTFFAHWTNRWFGYPDAFSHLCAALALLTSHPVALALTCVSGTLNDERWLISAPFIICWHASERAKADIFDWQIAAQATAGIVVGLCCVLLVRRALTVGWIGPGIADPGIYREMWTLVYSRLQPYGSNWWLFILNIAMGFGWYWFAILTAPRRLWSSGAAITAWVMAGTLLIGTAATVFVADVSRSIGFLYLGLVIAAMSAYDSDAHAAVRLWRNLLILGCITPTIYYTGYSGAAFVPLPLDAANMFLQSQYGIDVMQMMKSYFRLH